MSQQKKSLKIVLPFFVLSFLCAIVQAQWLPEHASILKDTKRWLHAVSFAESFKHGIRKVISEEKRLSPALERMLQASSAELEEVVAPIFAKHLSAEEARLMADFYESNAGKLITKQQFTQLGNSDPPIRLTAEQKLEYDRFMAGKGGRAVHRVLDRKNIRDEYMSAIQNYFNRE